MSSEGDIFIAAQVEGRFQHSSFLGGKAVSSAGEIDVVNGVPTRISNDSGHYLSAKHTLNFVQRELKAKGMNIGDDVLKARDDGFNAFEKRRSIF